MNRHDPELVHRVQTEIEALHGQYERWLRGESDDSRRIEASIPADFTFVTPLGEVVRGAYILANLHAGHGARQVHIRIENIDVLWSGKGGVIATYEEWHEHADHESARICTVLFHRDPDMITGLRWWHVHQTWKLPPPPRR